MKLFQQMLVAGAALSLIAPISAQASDINLEGINSYSRSKKTKKIFNSNMFNNDVAKTDKNVNSLEIQNYDFEAGSFSDTTTLDSKVIFTVGAVSYTHLTLPTKRIV